jgi:hypothetical protein
MVSLVLTLLLALGGVVMSVTGGGPSGAPQAAAVTGGGPSGAPVTTTVTGGGPSGSTAP